MLDLTAYDAQQKGEILTKNTAITPRNGLRFRVLGYMRVSLDEATTGSHTFETQEQRIRETLDRRYGVGQYDLELEKENGLSGSYGFEPTAQQKKVRPLFAKVKKMLETGEYDSFVVYKVNRLVRSSYFYHRMLEEVIYPSGALFLSATEDLDLDNPTGRATASIVAVVDAWFREGVVERCQDATLTRAKAGYYVGRTCYGWRWEAMAQAAPGHRRRILPHAEEGEWLRQIRAWFEAGWSAQRIVRELNERGVPSPSGKKLWWDTMVYHLLFNPVHAGLVPSSQGWLRGEHYERRYWDTDDLQRLETLRAMRKEKFKSNTLHTSAVQVLGGIVLCARCGKRLYTSAAGSIYRSYKCVSGQAQGVVSCSGVSIRADVLERLVVEQIETLAREPAMQAHLLAEAAGAAAGQDVELLRDQTQWREQVGSLQAKQERLMDKLAQDIITDAEFAAHNQKLRMQLQEARERLAHAEQGLSRRQQREAQAQAAQQMILDFPAVWEHLSADERREVLRQLVETLTVDREGRDLIVRLKVCLLPEQQITVARDSAVRMKEKPTGPAAVPPRQLVLLHYIGQGKTRQEAAEAMGIEDSTSRSFVRQIQKHLGTKNMTDAFAQCRPRIEQLKATLPFGPSELPQHKVSRERDTASRLSPLHREILPYLLRGATNPEIARLTGLTKFTVANRRNEITKILGTFSIYEIGEKVKALGIELPAIA